jgi:hypothetical protein
MGKLYLEYEEQEMMMLSSLILNDESEDSFESPEQQDDSMEELDTMFMPIYFYRRPIENAIEIDTEINTDAYQFLHLIVVRFSEDQEDGKTVSGKWHIAGVRRTRREARQVKEDIETGIYDGDDSAWNGDGKTLDEVDVFLIPIED